MKPLWIFYLGLISWMNFAQDTIQSLPVDNKFREDQFYFSISHQVFLNRPSDIAQNSFSPELRLGFLRDMPFTTNRQFAIAPGIGFSYKNINTNAIFSSINTKDINGNIVYSAQNINQFLIEVPLELRFRTATPTNFEFFRAHIGCKASYLFWSQSTFSGFDTFSVSNKNDFNAILWDVYLSIGFNSLNAFVSYGLNPMLKSPINYDGTKMDFRRMNFGLIFYIL